MEKRLLLKRHVSTRKEGLSMPNKRLNQFLILIILIVATIVLFRHHHTVIQAQTNLLTEATVASEQGQLEIEQLATLSETYPIEKHTQVLEQLGYEKSGASQFIKIDEAHQLTYVLSMQPSTTIDHFSKVVLSIYTGTEKAAQKENLLTTLETRTTWKAQNAFNEMGES